MNADPQLMAYLYGVPLWFYEAMIARWEADRIRS